MPFHATEVNSLDTNLNDENHYYLKIAIASYRYDCPIVGEGWASLVDGLEAFPIPKVTLIFQFSIATVPRKTICRVRVTTHRAT